MTNDERNILTEIAKSYNEDLQFETVHRQVMIYTLVANIVWVTGAIADEWGLVKIHEDQLWVTATAAMLIILNVTSCLCVHMKYKAQARRILHARNSCLQIRDSSKP